MRIQEIAGKSQIRNLNTGPISGIDRSSDEESPFGDVRKQKVKRNITTGNKLYLYTDLDDPDLNGIHPKYTQYTGMKPIFKNFASKFFEVAKNKEYQPVVRVDGYGYNLELKTTKGVTVSIAGNNGSKIPSKFRAFIGTANDQDSENKKQQLYTSLRTAFNLDATAFTQDGSKYYMDTGKPSLTLTGTEDERLKSFFDALPYIESMGKAPPKRSGSAMSLVTRENTPFRYYLGAATLIYVGVRFGLPHLIPRGGGETQGTFDINDDLITVGITKEGYDAYKSGEGSYREHAVPSNVIQQEAIKMVKNNRSGKFIDEKLIYEIAKMIKRNLMIVITSTDESTNKLDKVHKSTMPADWNPITGDPLRRFTDLGIEVYPISGGKRLRESDI